MIYVIIAAFVLWALIGSGVIEGATLEGLIPVLIIVGVIFLIVAFFSEGAKDEKAYRNRRNYWLKRGRRK